jgi:NAD(P)H-hydrate epimerase
VLIRAANAHGAPLLALDVPSGVDTATGDVHDPAIRATATLTLALPKDGLSSEAATEHVGELYVADISVPPQLYARPPLGIAVGPIFAKDDVIRLR